MRCREYEAGGISVFKKSGLDHVCQSLCCPRRGVSCMTISAQELILPEGAELPSSSVGGDGAMRPAFILGAAGSTRPYFPGVFLCSYVLHSRGEGS